MIRRELGSLPFATLIIDTGNRAYREVGFDVGLNYSSGVVGPASGSGTSTGPTGATGSTGAAGPTGTSTPAVTGAKYGATLVLLGV